MLFTHVSTFKDIAVNDSRFYVRLTSGLHALSTSPIFPCELFPLFLLVLHLILQHCIYTIWHDTLLTNQFWSATEPVPGWCDKSGPRVSNLPVFLVKCNISDYDACVDASPFSAMNGCVEAVRMAIVILMYEIWSLAVPSSDGFIDKVSSFRCHIALPATGSFSF